eukprot:TRINITY_DN3999_c0_g1_i2.p1 TRINITY_DN3999_c0_g1~~TRINITY_DN3999_c0_g1_i2.p1  ORF type:complete len:110 (-),score=7.62 TRINITY_DN3999_c0_g1_i2:730-1059(-)
MEDIYSDFERVEWCPNGNIKDTICKGVCAEYDAINRELASNAQCESSEVECELHYQDHCYRTSTYHLCKKLGICYTEAEFNERYCNSGMKNSINMALVVIIVVFCTLWF